MTNSSSHWRSALATMFCCAIWAQQAAATSLAFTYTDSSGVTMPYRLFLPAGYDAPGAEFPLVLFLHGSGESGTDNMAQVNNHIAGLISATQSGPYSAYLLAPQLPSPSGWGTFNSQDLSMDILNAVITAFGVDTNRLYLTGLSMGGFGTFEYMKEFPNKFAAAVPMSGGGDSSPQTAANIAHIPTWIFHGKRDTTVPVQDSIDMYNAMLAAGGSPKLTILPFGEHAIWDPIYNDATLNQYGLYPWLFSQSLSGPIPAATPEPASLTLLLLGAACAIPLARRRARRMGRRAIRPVAVLALAALAMLTVSSEKVGAAFVPPSGLAPGARYQLIFVTADAHDALSAVESTYNAFVTGEAALNPSLPKAKWFAVSSTEDTTTAKFNARYLNLPVYNTAGQLVATSANGLYPSTSHPLLAPVAYDQFGLDSGGRDVWTGSMANGNMAANFGLGAEILTARPMSLAGDSHSTQDAWLYNRALPTTSQLSFYALSAAIVFVPEPTTQTLLGWAVAMLGGLGWLRCRRRP